MIEFSEMQKKTKKLTVDKFFFSQISKGNKLKANTLARTDLLYMLNWGTQWTMVSYLKK